ncbi:MAG: bifunctional DNA-formamidopyrimidine glycosylase/DNA-(apurinic or apyrimidinic site) lyase [Deltaproteobacteria bacterium]|jgi:formamidopyrimidine-DNA glycosylase|nr:bifunctional DNA-formamidopyrimidine glycosylase/DNA-(apurinic or apyrimidinic site) lyase [Deltaproteobacteria bacterium]
MPELPEVETVVRTLAPQMLGRRIEAARVLHEKSLAAGKALLPRLRGARIESLHRRAKLVIIELRPAHGGRLFLLFHLKMTGRLFVHGEQIEPCKHTRLVFVLGDDAGHDSDGKGRQLFFDDARKFGYCRIMRDKDFAHWDFWNSLGPEPLMCSCEEFVARCRERRGKIKALLLDQTFVAGIGNIYADEILFRAGIAPQHAVLCLSSAQFGVLWEQMREVLREAIEHCGSSVRDYRDAHGNAGAFQNSFRVYGHAGRPCRACGSILEKSVVAGRGTVHCPNCQK